MIVFTMTQPLFLGFDLDGVIIDHTANKLMLAQRYGVLLTPEQSHAEHMSTYFTPEVFAEIREALYNEAPPALTAPLVQGAFRGLAVLRGAGVPYALISLRRDPIAAKRLLELRGLWGELFSDENVIFVRSGQEKYAAAQSLGVTHFTDDEPNILDIMSTIPHRILFDIHDQFSNRDDLTRVRNWEELTARVLAIGELTEL
jgi:hypothetical protein